MRALIGTILIVWEFLAIAGAAIKATNKEAEPGDDQKILGCLTASTITCIGIYYLLVSCP